jgi:hypothetical protein
MAVLDHPFLEILCIEIRILTLNKPRQTHRGVTVMAKELQCSLTHVYVPTGFTFVFLRVTADRTSELVGVGIDTGEPFKP